MSEKIILAIETSGRVGSLAIGRGEDLISEVEFSGFMRHSAELFITLEKLLNDTGQTIQSVKEVYITVGPGSFTGLRIAVTAAKMLGFSQNMKIIAVDAMDVIAENVTRHSQATGQQFDCIATILDAKKNLFYAAVFDRTDGIWQKILGTDIVTAEQLLHWLQANNKTNVGLLGEGLVYYANQFDSSLTHVLDKQYWPATAAGLFHVGSRMAQKGLFTDPMALTPMYLRQPDAVVKTIR